MQRRIRFASKGYDWGMFGQLPPSNRCQLTRVAVCLYEDIMLGEAKINCSRTRADFTKCAGAKARFLPVG